MGTIDWSAVTRHTPDEDLGYCGYCGESLDDPNHDPEKCYQEAVDMYKALEGTPGD